jgi:hypothetical protein
MEFNRLISLVLGFIVLILVFVWVNNRIQAGKNKTIDTNTTTQITLTTTPSPTGQAEKKGWKNPLAFLFGQQSPTPSVSITPTGTITAISTTPGTTQPSGTPPQVRIVTNSKYTESNSTDNVTQIPETGLPTLIIPLSFLALAGGMYIKRRS